MKQCTHILNLNTSLEWRANSEFKLFSLDERVSSTHWTGARLMPLLVWMWW